MRECQDSHRHGRGFAIPAAIPHHTASANRELVQLWIRQPAFRWPLALLALGLVLLLPIFPPTWYAAWIDVFSPLIFGSLAVWQLTRPSFNRRRAETRFWQSLQLGIVSWCLVLATRAIFASAGWDRQPLRPYFDLTFALAFVFFLIAIEERPDDRSPLADHGRRPPRWAAALFVVGLYCTLVALPILLDPAEYRGGRPSFTFFVILDGYLALRLLNLVVASPDRRWRLCYACLMGFFALLLIAETMILAAIAANYEAPKLVTDQLFQVALVFLVLATSCRPVFWSGRVQRTAQPPMSLTFAVPPVIWSLLFPAFLLLAGRLNLLSPTFAGERDVLVLLFTASLFTAAYVQQRRFETRIHDLVLERRQAEAKWRASEDDLRLLVERNRAAEKLRAAEERFAKAFEASPDPLLLTRLDDGVVLHANQAFEQLSGWARADLQGRSVVELGLFGESPSQLSQVFEALRDRGRFHGRISNLRRQAGEQISVRASFEILEDIEERAVLAVFRAENADAAEVDALKAIDWLSLAAIPVQVRVFDSPIFTNSAWAAADTSPEPFGKNPVTARDQRGRELCLRWPNSPGEGEP